MDKKLTDKEIVKALKDKIEFENFDENGYAVVDVEKLKNTLDLINRLQAEVERLKEEKSKLENKIDEIYPLVMQLPNAMQKAKAEAYKECIVKVKEKSNKYEWVSSGVHLRTEYTIGENTIDNLLNELVGE